MPGLHPSLTLSVGWGPYVVTPLRERSHMCIFHGLKLPTGRVRVFPLAEPALLSPVR